MSDIKQFVVIVGNDFSLRERNPAEYVSGIVYGSPKVTAVRLKGGGSQQGHFVALCEFTNEDVQAHSTFDRMGSFSYGATYFWEEAPALQEFGTWVAYYAETWDWAEAQRS